MRSICQLFVVPLHFGPDGQPLLLFGKLIIVFHKLLLAGFHGKVNLAEGNDLFPRVTVHHDQVAGVAGEHVIINLALSSLGESDHFPDVGKMIGRNISGIFAGLLGFQNYFLKVIPLFVFKSDL